MAVLEIITATVTLLGGGTSIKGWLALREKRAEVDKAHAGVEVARAELETAKVEVERARAEVERARHEAATAEHQTDAAEITGRYAAQTADRQALGKMYAGLSERVAEQAVLIARLTESLDEQATAYVERIKHFEAIADAAERARAKAESARAVAEAARADAEKRAADADGRLLAMIGEFESYKRAVESARHSQAPTARGAEDTR